MALPIDNIAVAVSNAMGLFVSVKARVEIIRGGNIIHSWEKTKNLRLSTISARIPNGKDRSIAGRKRAVWTKESINASLSVHFIIREVTIIFCIQKAIVDSDIPAQKILKSKIFRGLHIDKLCLS